jgi:RND family efflux transporter MFP subunit
VPSQAGERNICEFSGLTILGVNLLLIHAFLYKHSVYTRFPSLMTQTTPVDGPPPAQSAQKQVGLLGIATRILLPVVIIAGGFYAYQQLSVEVEKEQEPPPVKKSIRTRVAELHTQDYPIVIRKNGIIQAHNQVLLSAEVSGQVIKISPQFEVGTYFQTGDVLVEIDNRDYTNAVAMAEAQYDGAKAGLDLADLDLSRQEKLVRRNAASVAELNQAVAAKAQAEATLDSAETAVKQAKRNLERTKIRAPFNGRVRQRDLGLGQSVGAGAPLGVVFAVDFAEVRLPIAGPELQYLELPELAGDRPVDVELRDGINPDNKAVWKARIVRTEGTLDENSLELFAIARIDDPFGLKSGDPPLRIGQPVIGSITGKMLENVIAIPRTSVRQMDQVYLIDNQELTVSSKTIDPVWSDEDVILIRDPSVANGTFVATTRIVYAPDGAKVELIPDSEAENESATKTASKKSKESAEATN